MLGAEDVRPQPGAHALWELEDFVLESAGCTSLVRGLSSFQNLWEVAVLGVGGGGPRPGALRFRSRPGLLGCSSLCDLFQRLTFNHDKTVGKLIVLQDIRHQSPLILSEPDAS